MPMSERDRRLRFLEKRISELHSEGKSKASTKRLRELRRDENGVHSEAAVMISLARENTAASKYPGRLARIQADREWAAKRTDNPKEQHG